MAEKPTFNKLKSITMSKPLLDSSGNSTRTIQVVTNTVDDPVLSIVGPTGADGRPGDVGPTGPTGADGNPNMTLTSPNGTVYQLEVDNNGNITTTLLSGQGGGSSSSQSSGRNTSTS